MVSIVTACACSRTSAPRDSEKPVDDPYREKLFADFFVKEDSLLYNGFEVVKLEKEVTQETSGNRVRVSYAVLRKGDQVLAVFEGIYSPMGNGTAFGLASLLGSQSKQLLVSQTIPRRGRHWIADLDSNGAVLFDSRDFNLGREDALVMDIDKDGVSEIGLALTAFWNFGPTASSEQEALPMIVFKYDPAARKYLPANPFFAYGLDHIDEDAKEVDPGETASDTVASGYLEKRLGILLRYVYAGKREQGWAFFDRTYKRADVDQIRPAIQKRLEQEPIYSFIYGEPVKPRPAKAN